MFSIKAIVILSFLGLFTFTFGQMSIDQQIHAIKTASPEQRVQMMNNLKRNIATMQASQRRETINKLRANLSQHQTMSKQVHNNGYQNRQMQHNNDMQHSEIMMQKEAVDRYMQQGSMPLPSNTMQENKPLPPNTPQLQHDFNTNWSK